MGSCTKGVGADTSNWIRSNNNKANKKMKSLLIFFLFVGISFGAPLQGPGRIGDDLPELKPYQPEKQPNVPIKLGHRRCDNIYHQAILPCLLRPELPPFSYSTERYYNTEYKKK